METTEVDSSIQQHVDRTIAMVQFTSAVGLYEGMMFLRKEGNVNEKMKPIYRQAEAVLDIHFEKQMDKAVANWLLYRKHQLEVKKKRG